jgi:hypothetical protein
MNARFPSRAHASVPRAPLASLVVPATAAAPGTHARQEDRLTSRPTSTSSFLSPARTLPLSPFSFHPILVPIMHNRRRQSSPEKRAYRADHPEL